MEKKIYCISISYYVVITALRNKYEKFKNKKIKINDYYDYT